MKKLVLFAVGLAFSLTMAQNGMAIKDKSEKVLKMFLYSGTELSLYSKPDSRVLTGGDEDLKLFSAMFFVGMNIEFLLLGDRLNPFLDIRFGNTTIRSDNGAPSMESFQNLEEAKAVGFDLGLKVKVFKPKAYHIYGVGTYGGLIPTVKDSQKGFYNNYFAGIGAELTQGKIEGSHIEIGATKNYIIDNYVRAHVRVDLRIAELFFLSVAIDNDLGKRPDDFRFLLGYQSRVLGF